MTTIADIMTRSIATVRRDETLQAAARRMQRDGRRLAAGPRRQGGRRHGHRPRHRRARRRRRHDPAGVAGRRRHDRGRPLLPRRRHGRAGDGRDGRRRRCAACRCSTPTTKSSASLPWPTSPRDNRRTPTKLCARSRRPVVEFTSPNALQRYLRRAPDRPGGAARAAPSVGVRLADAEGLQRQPGPAARRRGGVLRAAVDRAAADPDGDRAVARDRPGASCSRRSAATSSGWCRASRRRSSRELANFLDKREGVGWLLLGTMIFFSSLAFTVLENAMSVIFLHRVVERKRRFIFSVLIPYVYILSLGVGLLLVTLVAGSLQAVGKESVELFGREWSLSGVSGVLLYLLGFAGEIFVLTSVYLVMPAGRLALAPRADRRRHGGGALGDHAPRPRLVLRDAVAGDDRLRLADDGDRRPAEPRDRRDAAALRRPGHLRVRADRPRAGARAEPGFTTAPVSSAARAHGRPQDASSRGDPLAQPAPASRRPRGDRLAGDEADAAEQAAPERLRHRLRRRRARRTSPTGSAARAGPPAPGCARAGASRRP